MRTSRTNTWRGARWLSSRTIPLLAFCSLLLVAATPARADQPDRPHGKAFGWKANVHHSYGSCDTGYPDAQHRRGFSAGHAQGRQVGFRDGLSGRRYDPRVEARLARFSGYFRQGFRQGFRKGYGEAFEAGRRSRCDYRH